MPECGATLQGICSKYRDTFVFNKIFTSRESQVKRKRLKNPKKKS